jgi:N-acetylglucosaminyl-diphospho-decaprenol L-rhamnosyltransferase
MVTDRRTTIVVVTWNSADHIQDFLRAIPDAMRDSGRWGVVVVDNDSSDGTTELARTAGIDVTIVSTGRNAGYAAGINAGIAASPDCDGYLFLNADVRLAPSCVAELWRAVEHPGCGIAVPRLVDENQHLQWSLRREPRVSRTLGEAVLGGRRAGRYRALGEVVTNADDYARDHTVDWATGAAWLVTADCVARVGRWDESFFLYSEETDYALRARDAGLVVRYASRAEAVHLGGEVHEISPLYNVMTRNRVVLYRRRHRLVPSIAFWAATLLNEALRSGSAVHRVAARELVLRSSALLRS